MCAHAGGFAGDRGWDRGKCKTETSRRPVPINQFTVDELAEWKTVTCYAASEDWVFVSEKALGKMPPWADTPARWFPATGSKAGRDDEMGCLHTLRHTYSTLLKANGEDVKVVQELMGHANERADTGQTAGVLARLWMCCWIAHGMQRKMSRKVWRENQRIENVSRFSILNRMLLKGMVGTRRLELLTSTVSR